MNVSTQDPDSRSREEVLTDRSVLLYLINKCNKYGKMDGETKLEKMAFYTERALNNLKKKILNYGFFTYKHGVFSKGVVNDLNHFRNNDLVKLTNGKIIPTERGEEIIDFVEDHIERNGLEGSIDEQVERVADLSNSEVKRRGYKAEVEYAGKKKKIGDLPQHVDILKKLSDREAEEKIEFSDEELETLEHLMDKKGYMSVKDSLEQIKQGNIV